MQALILVGGKGTRLEPYTAVLPKSLMPLGEYPILEIVLRQLQSAGTSDVILAVGHLSHLFEAFFEDGKRFGMRISYSFEDEPLGTAGPIANALDRLEEDFLVINGDLLTTISYAKIFETHRENGAAATIGIFDREEKIDFGVIETDAEGKLEKYTEKPTYQFSVSMGVNVLNKAAVATFLKPGEYMDLPDLLLKLKDSGETVQCFREPCEWLDIGRMEDYKRAIELFESDRSTFMP